MNTKNFLSTDFRFFFSIEFSPCKAIKPQRRNRLLDVEELENENIANNSTYRSFSAWGEDCD